MRKIISYSLWGTKSKYTTGAIRNVELARKIFPEWECHFYLAKDVSSSVINSLSENAHLHLTDKPGDWKFATERFNAIDENTDFVIFRDTDSRLSYREKEAVDEWIESGKTLHIMKDHPFHHTFPILAGLWGLKKSGFNKSISCLLSIYHNTEQYHYDQIFLEKFIWPELNEDCLIHDDFSIRNKNTKKFPKKRNGLSFIGQPFDEDENIESTHTKALKAALFNLQRELILNFFKKIMSK